MSTQQRFRFPPRRFVVTVSGPRGAGRGSLSRFLATALDLVYFKTANYRNAVAHAMIFEGHDVANAADVVCRVRPGELTDPQRIWRAEVLALSERLVFDPPVAETLANAMRHAVANVFVDGSIAGAVVDVGAEADARLSCPVDVALFVTASASARSARLSMIDAQLDDVGVNAVPRGASIIDTTEMSPMDLMALGVKLVTAQLRYSRTEIRIGFPLSEHITYVPQPYRRLVVTHDLDGVVTLHNKGVYDKDRELKMSTRTSYTVCDVMAVDADHLSRCLKALDGDACEWVADLRNRTVAYKISIYLSVKCQMWNNATVNLLVGDRVMKLCWSHHLRAFRTVLDHPAKTKYVTMFCAKSLNPLFTFAFVHRRRDSLTTNGQHPYAASDIRSGSYTAVQIEKYMSLVECSVTYSGACDI